MTAASPDPVPPAPPAAPVAPAAPAPAAASPGPGEPFPPAGRERWRALARAVLVRAGAPADVDPELALTRVDPDGIAVPPLFLAEDDPGVPAVTRAPGAWDVRVAVDDPDPARAAAAALADLEGGATSLWLRTGPGGLDPADLPRALEGVLLDLAGVVLDAGRAVPDGPAGTGAGPDADVARRAAEALLALPLPPGASGSLGLDPVAAAFRRGARELPPGAEAVAPGLARDAQAAGLRTLTVDGTAYHDAGATDAQEIAFATAAAVHQLRGLEGVLDPAAAFAAVEFRLAVTDRQFPQLAKLRAARRVWARVAELAGVPEAAQHQHAVTSAAMLATRDPWVNLLRTTVAAVAAATGGADAVTVLPFDSALGRPDAFGRRVARNTHAVLHDEASLARVLDPAAGSWYVEWLTDRLAQRAWDLLTALERTGGVVAALARGELAGTCAAARAERERRVATRAQPLTGVSEFPDPAETRPARDPAAPVPGLWRWAQPFEALRQRADDLPVRPRVTLVALGPRAAHAARVGFATNLFAAGGIAVDVVTDPAAAGTAVACLCSSDAVYATDGAGAVAAARAAGAGQVWVAGTAAVAGADGVVHGGADVLAVLHAAWAATGAPGAVAAGVPA